MAKKQYEKCFKKRSYNKINNNSCKKSPEELAIEEDSKTRGELNVYIMQKIKEGKGKEEIVKRVKFVYRDEKYQKYYKYLDGWIENFMAKANSNDREER